MIPTLTNDFEELKTSVEEVTADVLELAKEIEVEPKYVTEILQSHDNLMNEGLLLMDEQRKWFLEMESTPDEDSIKTIKMTTKE